MTSPDRIASAFGLKSSSPGTYKIRCPAHNDRNPSLSVTITPEKALVSCHAKCPTDAVLQTVGLKPADLFFDEKQAPRHIVAKYEYRDASGKLKYTKTRFEPKSFTFKDAAGNYGLNGTDHILYRLDEINNAIGGNNPVFLCEGEKDADTIRKEVQCYATSLDCGALSFTSSTDRFKPLDALIGSTVYIVPDQDAPGIVHGDVCAKYLSDRAKEVFVVKLNGFKDVTEFFESGGTPEEFRNICAAVEPWKPAMQKSAIYHFSWSDNPPEVKPLLSFKGTGILWPEGIALLTGPQGKGKSNIFHAIAAATLNPGCDALGFSDVIKPLILIDTENPLSIFRKNTRRGLCRAGLIDGELISGVEYINIRGIETFEERQEYLFGLIAENKYRLYLIDGAGDFVLDVNDIDTAIPFVSKLCAITLKQKCGVFLTLHGNPGVQNEKARGHLGSELLRKADCSMLLKVDGNSRCITTTFSQGKNRAGNDNLTQHFEWNEFLEMHVSCEAPAGKTGKKIINRDNALNLMNNIRWSHSDLSKEIMTQLEKSKPTASRWIKELTEIGEVIKNHDGTYQRIVKDNSTIGWVHD